MTTGVAVVIPARSDEVYLESALSSVLSQPETAQVVVSTHCAASPVGGLARTHPDQRVELAVSSGSSPGENLDAGVALTTAQWVAFLDADDMWPPGRLALGLSAFSLTPGLEMCLGHQRAITSRGVLVGPQIRAPLLGAVLVRHSVLARVGRFGPGLVAQMRWLLRARELGVSTAVLDEVVLHRRSHPGNLTRTRQADVHQEYLGVARDMMRRRRETRS